MIASFGAPTVEQHCPVIVVSVRWSTKCFSRCDPTGAQYSKGGEAIGLTKDAVDEDDDSLACGGFFLAVHALTTLFCSFALSHLKQASNTSPYSIAIRDCDEYSGSFICRCLLLIMILKTNCYVLCRLFQPMALWPSGIRKLQNTAAASAPL